MSAPSWNTHSAASIAARRPRWRRGTTPRCLCCCSPASLPSCHATRAAPTSWSAPRSNLGRFRFERLIGFFVNTLALRSGSTAIRPSPPRFAPDPIHAPDAGASGRAVELLVQELNPPGLSRSRRSSRSVQLPAAAPERPAGGLARSIRAVTIHTPAREVRPVRPTCERHHSWWRLRTTRALHRGDDFARRGSKRQVRAGGAPASRLQPFSVFDTLDPEERPLVPRSRSASPTPVSDDPRRVSDQARATPTATAVVDNGRWLTYAELERASADVAASLLGSRPPTRRTQSRSCCAPRAHILTAVPAAPSRGGVRGRLTRDNRRQASRACSLRPGSDVRDDRHRRPVPCLSSGPVDRIEALVGRPRPAPVPALTSRTSSSRPARPGSPGFVVEHRAVVNLLHSIAVVTAFTGDRMLA